MATPENTFISSVHRHLPVDIYHMKNHNQYNGGIPDVWYSGPKGDLWIEYKFIVVPKRPETAIKIDLSELQKNWLSARHAEGRSVAVVVGSKEGGVWFDGICWMQQINTREFVDSLVTRSDLATRINNAVY